MLDSIVIFNLSICIESISEWKQHDTSKCIVLMKKKDLVRRFNRSHLFFFMFLLYLNLFYFTSLFHHFNLLLHGKCPFAVKHKSHAPLI